MSPRVCMVIDRFYPQVGGTETQALNLSEVLQKMGVELFVLTRRTLREMAPYEEVRGVRVNRVLPSGTGKLSLLFATLSFAFFLFRHRNEYDIIHSHSFGWVGPVSACMGRLLRKKVIVKIATAGDVTGRITGKGQIPAPINRIRLKLLKLSAGVVCISSEIHEELLKKSFKKKKLIQIPNGVDIARFRPGGGIRRFLPADRINIIFSGRLVFRKGVDILLKAFERLAKEPGNVQLHILGSGRLQMGDEYEDVLRRFVKENGLEDDVIFHGDVVNVEDYLKEADIFAFPSRHEGLPNALLEAMACGLAVVATSIGGVVDVIMNEENGILVNSDDSEGLGAALTKLIDSPDERFKLGAAARNTVETRYSLDVTADKFVELYSDLISKETL